MRVKRATKEKSPHFASCAWNSTQYLLDLIFEAEKYRGYKGNIVLVWSHAFESTYAFDCIQSKSQYAISIEMVCLLTLTYHFSLWFMIMKTLFLQKRDFLIIKQKLNYKNFKGISVGFTGRRDYLCLLRILYLTHATYSAQNF